MLVLTRKQNEKIRIGDSVVITVVRMKGKAVRLGIEAPSDVNILRGELVFESEADDSSEENASVETSVSVPASPRNPASRWPGGQRDERGGSSWPATLTDSVR